jgi:hypothetical protein
LGSVSLVDLIPLEFYRGWIEPVGERSIQLDAHHTFIYNDEGYVNATAALAAGVEFDFDGITVPNHRLVNIPGPGLLIRKEGGAVVPIDPRFGETGYLKEYLLRNMFTEPRIFEFENARFDEPGECDSD